MTSRQVPGGLVLCRSAVVGYQLIGEHVPFRRKHGSNGKKTATAGKRCRLRSIFPSKQAKARMAAPFGRRLAERDQPQGRCRQPISRRRQAVRECGEAIESAAMIENMAGDVQFSLGISRNIGQGGDEACGRCRSHLPGRLSAGAGPHVGQTAEAAYNPNWALIAAFKPAERKTTW